MLKYITRKKFLPSRNRSSAPGWFGKRTSPLSMRATQRATCSVGNNLVACVMPNVSASQPWNPGSFAPVTGNLFFIHSEIGFVRGNAAATAKHDARYPPDLGVAGNMKQRSINSVHCLSHLFQHEHMSVEVRLQRRAK